MQCAVLGSLEVRGDDGAAVTVPGAKERHLLALLAAAFPASVSVDQLLESLWDGAPPRTGRKSLQAHVVRLRTALEPGRPTGSPGRYVVRRHDGYALAIDREQLDATRFADLAARGRALLAAGDAQAADDLLRQALDLWRGRPYSDWPDSTDLDAERERLEAIRTHVLEAYWEAELALGRHADAAPELGRLTREEPLQEAWWALHALALYRCGRQADALETLRNARRVLDEQLGVEPGLRLRELEQAILDQDPSLAAATSPTSPEPAPAPPAVTITGCPYKGLAHYETDDAPVFRGRDRLIRTLVTALVDRSLLVVSGSSGAGKSSVVRAGLLPALGAGALPSSDQWEPVVVVPGRSPVDALAPLTGEDPPAAPVVLVCDQLEQLWSDEVTAGERTAFLDTVLGLLSDKVVARCLLVVRGDHVGRLAEHPDVAQRLHGALVMVPPMTETELREVVEEPAHVAGLTVEPDLTDLAVRDVLGRSGALPLLSTALAETWQRRRDDTLTLAGYLASGGVTGAVARSAEAAYASLSEPGRELARRILVRLAEQDEHGTLRARRLPVAELALVAADPAVTDEVIETLTARRLVARHDDRLEVTHEALLSAWPRLSTWLADDAVGRSVRRHLAPDALEWHAHGRPEDELYRGTRLEAAAQWAADPDSAPTEIERAFVEASVARAEAELALARFRAQVEAAGRRRVRRLAAVLAVALVVALVSAAVAVGFQRTSAHRASEARAAGTIADANRLAALASNERALDVSLLLAVAAVRTADTTATRGGLLSSLTEHRRATGVHQLVKEGIQQTDLSANGRSLIAVVGGGSPRVLLWRPGEPTPPVVLDEDFWPTSVAVSADGNTTVATGGDNNGKHGLFAYTSQGDLLRHVNLQRLGGWPIASTFTPDRDVLIVAGTRRGWAGIHGLLAKVDLATGRVTRVAWVGHTESVDEDLAASFSADGRGLVLSGVDGQVAWHRDLSTGRQTRLALRDRDAASIRVEALPSGAAQLWSDGAITRYDERGRAVQELDAHRAAVRDVRVLPGGATAVTTGDDGQVVLWDIERPQGRWLFGESLEGHEGPVVQAELSSDARSLLTVGADGQAVTWDLTPGAGRLGTTFPGLEGRYVSNRVEVVEPGHLAVAPTRPLSRLARGPDETPGDDTLQVSAVFFDPRTGEVVDEVDVGATLQSVFGSSVAVSPDRSRVSVTTILRATVLDTRTREVLGRVRIPGVGLSDSTWSQHGTRLILATERFLPNDVLGRLAVVDPTTWEVERMVRLSEGTPQVLEWSPDGETLAVGLNFTGSVAVLDRDLGGERLIKLGEGGDVFDLSFSPDGRYLAAGRVGGVLTVLDTRTWKPVHESVALHAEPITDVEWLPDSKTVLSTARDEMVTLYDVEQDFVAGRLPASTRPGDGYTFMVPAPGDAVTVLNEGDPGRVYPLDPARWLALACGVAGRDLTHAEWDRYLPGTPYRRVCDLG